jgi:uncharacterized membrane protein YukC
MKRCFLTIAITMLVAITSAAQGRGDRGDKGGLNSDRLANRQPAGYQSATSTEQVDKGTERARAAREREEQIKEWMGVTGRPREDFEREEKRQHDQQAKEAAQQALERERLQQKEHKEKQQKEQQEREAVQREHREQNDTRTTTEHRETPERRQRDPRDKP